MDTPQNFDFDVVCIALINEEGNLIGQLRDDKPGINDPGKVGCFGGYMEEGEAPAEAIIRELHEETNLQISPDDIAPYGQIITGTDERFRHHVFIAKGVSTEGLEVYEGQRHYTVKDSADPRLTSVMRFTAEKWFKERDFIVSATAEHTEVHRYAATFFVALDGTLYGQLRDNKPGIDQPGKIGGFGGACESGETPLQTAVRELHEETNRTFNLADLEEFSRFIVWRPLTKEYEQGTIYVIRNFDMQGLKVYEGQGAAPVMAGDQRISLAVRPAVNKWFAR